MKVTTHLYAEKLCADIPPDSTIRNSGDSISLHKKAEHESGFMEFAATNITPQSCKFINGQHRKSYNMYETTRKISLTFRRRNFLLNFRKPCI
jgi:hypothetical protein